MNRVQSRIFVNPLYAPLTCEYGEPEMSHDLFADLVFLGIALGLAAVMVIASKHRSDDKDRDEGHDDHFI